MELYQALKSIGVDDASATQACESVMGEFATKTDITELRGELKTTIANLRCELKTEMADLRTEIIAVKKQESQRLLKANIISATLIIAANAAVISLL